MAGLVQKLIILKGDRSVLTDLRQLATIGETRLPTSCPLDSRGIRRD